MIEGDQPQQRLMTFNRIDLAKAPVEDDPNRVTAVSLSWVRVVYAIFIAAVLVRIFLVDQLVNDYWSYTKEGGSFPAKIHPGSYLVFFAASLLYLTPGYRFATRDLPVLRAILIFAAGSAAATIFPILQGRNGPAGYVIDVYLMACVACIFLLAMPAQWRRITGLIVICALALNSIIAMGEFASGRYIVYVEATEFRPAGLLGASLNVGVINLAAAVFLIALPLHWIWKYGLVTVLMAGVLISASRTAMLLASIVLPVSILITARRRNHGASMGATAVLMAIFAIVVVPILFLLLSEYGFLDRFKAGYIDDSAQTRLDIYRVFEFVGWRDILFGMDIHHIRTIAREMLGIQLIESAIILFVFDFGLLCALFFGLMLLYLLTSIARHSHPVIGLGVFVFLLLALTNNTLATKVPSAIAVLVMAISLNGFGGRKAH